MSKAACQKEIINGESQGAMSTFHRFRDLGLVRADEFLQVMRKERELLETLRNVNRQIADRQPDEA